MVSQGYFSLYPSIKRQYIRKTPTSMIFRITILLLSFLIHGISLAATKLYVWSVYLYSYSRLHGVAVTTRETVWIRVHVQFIIWHMKKNEAGIRKSVRLSLQKFRWLLGLQTMIYIGYSFFCDIRICVQFYKGRRTKVP